VVVENWTVADFDRNAYDPGLTASVTANAPSIQCMNNRWLASNIGFWSFNICEGSFGYSERVFVSGLSFCTLWSLCLKSVCYFRGN
jgi:hypothetical protein